MKGTTYLTGVEQMEACNQCLGYAGISFNQVHGVVTDSTAYSKKTIKDVLSAVLLHSTHVLCVAHIVNLDADVFQKYEHFHHTGTLITMIKSSFYKKPERKARFRVFCLTL